MAKVLRKPWYRAIYFGLLAAIILAGIVEIAEGNSQRGKGLFVIAAIWVLFFLLALVRYGGSDGRE
jgi:uncharacterized membrane protein YozB (DUF420 family)